MVFITEQYGRRGGGTGGTGAGPRTAAPPKKGFSFGPATPYISFAVLCLAPTIFWGIFQFGFVFDFIQEALDIMNPGLGVFGRWIVFLICPFILPHVILAAKAGGFTRSQYPDPKTGEPMKIYKGASLFLWMGLYWAIAILAVVFFKPFITEQLVTPGINLLIQAISITPGVSESAPLIAEAAQKAGIKVTLSATQEKTLEDRLCGVVTKYDERGNIISGGKQISVEIVDAPQIIRNAASSGGSVQGTLYRPTIKITNIGKEPIDVVVKKGQLPGLGGNPYYTINSDDRKGEPVALGRAEGSYVSGRNIEISKRDKVYFLLTPLDCLEESGGCRIEPGLDKTVELITPQKITADYELLSSDGKKTGELKELNNFVVLDENTFASLHVEVVVRYNKENAKGEGTGHLLIFPDRETATSIQKSPGFKKNYCSNTFSGPLNVVVTPPFYVVGNTKDGGDGYFESAECPKGIKEFEQFERVSPKTTYCVQNIKTVKIKLVNSDKESKIKLSKITVSPFKTDTGASAPQTVSPIPADVSSPIEAATSTTTPQPTPDGKEPDVSDIQFDYKSGKYGTGQKAKSIAIEAVIARYATTGRFSKGEYARPTAVAIVNGWEDVGVATAATMPGTGAQATDDKFPPEYVGFGDKNCFYSFFGEESDLAIKFKDSDGTVRLGGIPAFSSDATFLCRYRINDYPPTHPDKIEMEDFKDFEFRVNVLYDYITEVETTAIQVVSQE